MPSCQVLNEQLLDEQSSNEIKNITLCVHSTSAEFLDGISGVDNHMHYNTTLLYCHHNGLSLNFMLDVKGVPI